MDLVCKTCYRRHPKVMQCDACDKILVCRSQGVVNKTWWFPVMHPRFGLIWEWSGTHMLENKFMNLFFCHGCKDAVLQAQGKRVTEEYIAEIRRG